MSAPASGSADRARRDRDTVIALFATVLHLALVVCAFGFVSLLADVDVVSRPGTGALVGSAMLATGVVVVLVALVREARRDRPTERPLGWALLVGVAALAGYVAAGVVLVAIEDRTWFDGVFFAATTLGSAFPYIVGVLAAVVAGAFLLVARSSGERPQWRWERQEED